MPRNRKEAFIFTTLMCFLMVLGMSVYNLWLHDNLSFSSFVTGFIPAFVAAFILDVFIVGILAKKIAFQLPINHQSKLQLVLTITVLMILGMVTFMSLFGLVMEIGFSSEIWSAYAHTWLLNFLAALPLQLLVVGPCSRYVLSNIQLKSSATR
ncbi:DUF2798 domain-containing protein [Listeria floridensis]|nr:DUF2798 domain-containing protein [Listeria floridensis]